MYTYDNHSVFNPDHSFYKGNLHCHSTVSDGRMTHGELIAAYRARGYSFLCFSDHERFTDNTGLDSADFISLPGVEWSCDRREGDVWLQTHHMHGIQGNARMVSDASQPPLTHGEVLPRLPFTGRDTPRQMAAYMVERGSFCIYNHPLWSCVPPADMGALEGYTAIEVYNYGCDLENHTGYGDVHWDCLLAAGRRILAVATDDNHNRTTPDDSFGGWICVNAPTLTHEAIVDAIVGGRYYSSSGPVIRGYGVRNGVVYVECEPVHHINFVAGGAVAVGRSVWSGDKGDSLTAAEYPLSGKERYVRMECVDSAGRIAWSNPIFPVD